MDELPFALDNDDDDDEHFWPELEPGALAATGWPEDTTKGTIVSDHSKEPKVNWFVCKLMSCCCWSLEVEALFRFLLDDF